MYRFRKILPGNYRRIERQGYWNIIADKDDVFVEQMEFSDNHKSELVEDFIKINAENGEEILIFTKKYGPIISIGLEVFRESAKAQGKSLPADIDEEYPFPEAFAFPEYQFKFFHELVINIWELQNDILQRRHDKKLFWDFFRLLFQPYGWCKHEPKHLAGDSKEPMMMFASIYYEIMQSQSSQINTNGIKEFICIMVRNKYNQDLYKIIRDGNKVVKKEKPKEYIEFINDVDILHILEIINYLWDTEIFDYLDCSFDEFEISVELKSINDAMIQTIRDLGRILICDIVNEYITLPSLCINEKGDFVMEIGDKFLLNIIFDELVVLCQFYEVRKCKFRKCHKYFIAKKGKQKNYCCKDCADKEIKYQIREGRRSKKERKYQI